MCCDFLVLLKVTQYQLFLFNFFIKLFSCRKKDSDYGSLQLSIQASKRKLNNLHKEKLAKILKPSDELAKDCEGSFESIPQEATSSVLKKIEPEVLQKYKTLRPERVIEHDKDVAVKYTKFDYSKIDIFSTLQTTYTSEDQKTSIPSTSGQRKNVKSRPTYYSLMDYQDTKHLSAANTWQEFKSEHQHRLLRHEQPLATDEHTPLITGVPLVEDDLSDILDKLQLSKTAQLSPSKR